MNKGKNPKTSESMKGNKNAEKWTEETVLPILFNMHDTLKNDHGREYIHLGSLLYDNDLYSDIWFYWSEKFRKNQTVFSTIKKISQHFENVLINGALKNELNPTVSIFSLKHNYKWKDRHEVDVTTNGESINHSELSTEELIARANAAKAIKENE